MHVLTIISTIKRELARQITLLCLLYMYRFYGGGGGARPVDYVISTAVHVLTYIGSICWGDYGNSHDQRQYMIGPNDLNE